METWRTVAVAPERVPGWLAGFAERHGSPTSDLDSGALRLVAPDGAVALLTTRWPDPLDPADPTGSLIAVAQRPRRLGMLLVRRERHAVGVLHGGAVVDLRTGRHYVQGKTKAGGWSQQRYARRRDNQAKQAYEGAANDAAALLEPIAHGLDGLLQGGDAAGLDTVLADRRLARTHALATRIPLPRLDVGDPDRPAALAFPARYAAVIVRLNDLA